MAEQLAHNHNPQAPERRTYAPISTMTTPPFPMASSEQDSSTANARQHGTEATAAPLLNAEKLLSAPQGWPTSPKRIRSPWWIIVWNGMFDLTLFTCAVAFLAFAGIVSHYDQASTAENPRTVAMLLNATKYVNDVHWIRSQLQLKYHRDRLFSLFYLL